MRYDLFSLIAARSNATVVRWALTHPVLAQGSTPQHVFDEACENPDPEVPQLLPLYQAVLISSRQVLPIIRALNDPPYPFQLRNASTALQADHLTTFLYIQAEFDPQWERISQWLEEAASSGAWRCLDYLMKEKGAQWGMLSEETIRFINPIDEGSNCPRRLSRIHLEQLLARGFPLPTNYDQMLMVTPLVCPHSLISSALPPFAAPELLPVGLAPESRVPLQLR